MTNARPNEVGTGAVVAGGHDERTATDGDFTTVPAAEVIAVHRDRTTREIAVRCPYCDGLHRHLWPRGADTVGLRIAHCTDAETRSTYWVPTPGAGVAR